MFKVILVQYKTYTFKPSFSTAVVHDIMLAAKVFRNYTFHKNNFIKTRGLFLLKM